MRFYLGVWALNFASDVTSNYTINSDGTLIKVLKFAKDKGCFHVTLMVISGLKHSVTQHLSAEKTNAEAEKCHYSE